MSHVQDFIEGVVFRPKAYNSRGDVTYAAWFFLNATLPAVTKCAFVDHMPRELYCRWKGQKYRCTGASRLGDVWLTSDLKQTTGYEHRVDVMECDQWSQKP